MGQNDGAKGVLGDVLERRAGEGEIAITGDLPRVILRVCGREKKMAAAPGKVTISIVDYSNKAIVAEALKGADVLVSTFGHQGAYEPLEAVLIQAGKLPSHSILSFLFNLD